MIPWFPGGHADPWNHIEAAMALAIGEHRAEAEAAYQWLVDCQRPDGSWHQYYLEHEIEQDKLDANVIAYIATGSGITSSSTATRASSSRCGRWSTRRSLRARSSAASGRDPLGPASRRHTLVVRPADRFIVDRPFATLRHRNCAGTRTRASGWELARTPRPCDPSRAGRRILTEAPLGDGLVLPGVVRRDLRRGRAPTLPNDGTFMLDDKGIRCVSDRPWVTAAETCECAMALGSASVRSPNSSSEGAGDARRRRQVHHRHRAPRPRALPARRTVDLQRCRRRALCRSDRRPSPAARLFSDHSFLPPIIDIDPVDSEAPVAD